MIFFDFLNRFQLRAWRMGKNPWHLFAFVVAAYTLHVISMVVFEGLSLNDADWLTATTITTTGYGDLSAKTFWGRQATKVFIYAGGIFVLASAIGALTESKAEKAALKLAGKWRWKMRDHVLIVSPLGRETTEYYERLVREIRHVPEYKDICIQILSPSIDQITEELKRLGVVFYRGSGSESDLIACDFEKAKAVVVLGDSRDPHSDALVFDIVSRADHGAFIVAEVVDDMARGRFKKVGADVLVHPARGYPGMLARALTSPGTEQIMEEMFSSSGQTVIKVSLTRPRHLNVPQTVLALVQAGKGVVVGSELGGEVTIGVTGKTVEADALFLLTDEQQCRALDVREALVDA